MTALDVALDGWWSAWYGLDPGLSPASLAARFSPVRDRRPAAGGGGEIVQLTPPDPLAGLRVVDEGGCTALVELDEPLAQGGVQVVLRGLGPPALTQPARLIRYRYETTDHVYPARGLALVVAVAYDHGLPGVPPDRTPQLIRAELFVPTDLDGWQQAWGRYGVTAPPRRGPLH